MGVVRRGIGIHACLRLRVPNCGFAAAWVEQDSNPELSRPPNTKGPLMGAFEFGGGERGIRTLEGLLTLTPLAGERFRPLSHLSVEGRIVLSEIPSVKWFSPPDELLGISVTFSSFLALNSLVDFFPVHCDVFGCIDPDSDLISLDPQDSDRDIAPDHYRLSSASRQNQHDFLLLPGGAPAPFLLRVVLPKLL